ncbi:hypothetical protein LY28_03713 [Ruminiclostridium sufflavum DSM 19573]|uniref:DUF5710 domain-containing protein n=1 Tax=Ruminiclostridium sufflavum DSM 19573 TaxID=1121337 RepID=A0A318XHC2_9FIRM|nr:hypothetical protein [Ruminiclostridium sufflavum]PYG84261.1 hypothetical protein LY28_03713 [Ruminiclostridium sufflavum DSM 19573]
MSLLVDIPFSLNNEAKAHGAKWSPEFNKWYFPTSKTYYPKYDKWILNSIGNVIICDYFYIIKTKKQCYNCSMETEVIALGIENFYPLDGKYLYKSGEIHISPIKKNSLPDEIMDIIEECFSSLKPYSEFPYSNYCQYCDARMGNYYLFNSSDTPFFISSYSEFINLELIKIHLKHDFVSNVDIKHTHIDNYFKLFDIKHNCNLIELFPYAPKQNTYPQEKYSGNHKASLTKKIFIFFIAIFILSGLQSCMGYIKILIDNSSKNADYTSASFYSVNTPLDRLLVLSFKIGEHPGARGTYIEVKDGKKVIISEVYSKGSRLEFYNDKSLIVTNSDSSQKTFILNNDTIDLEVANSFTQIFHGEKSVKGLHKFKYNYTKNEILK